MSTRTENLRLVGVIFIGMITSGSPIYGQHSLMNESIFTCSKDLKLPLRGPSQKAGARIGPITVKVVPDSEGRPHSITLGSTPSSADGWITSAISDSTFKPTCAGKVLFLQFSFVVEGTPVESAWTWMTFQAPNHFIIHNRPTTPSPFVIPDDPGKK
jgi:hypothetical protein